MDAFHHKRKNVSATRLDHTNPSGEGWQSRSLDKKSILERLFCGHMPTHRRVLFAAEPRKCIDIDDTRFDLLIQFRKTTLVEFLFRKDLPNEQHILTALKRLNGVPTASE